MNEQQLPERRPAGPRFVEPIRAYRMPDLPTEADYSPLAVPSPAQADVQLRTTYTDRANGFVRAVTPLSMVAGALGLVAGVGLFSVPILSFGALLWFFTWFGLVWLVAWLAHVFVSPDGSTWLHTLMLWRVVQREQRFRHERFWTTYYDHKDRDA